MKNITISVTDEFYRHLCKMSKEEIQGPGGDLGTITRKGLEAEVARHEAKIAAFRQYFMQEVHEESKELAA